MKTTRSARLIAIALVCIGALIIGGCASTTATDSRDVIKTGEVRIFEVFGMDCPGCHGGVEKLVEAIPGVLDAQASWESKRITVILSEGSTVADETIRETIARANFTAGERLQ
mgnify:CR=1 FL=1